MEIASTKPKVLYVDDEEENLLVFKATFRKMYEVFTASSAAKGREILNENPVEVIISDQRMPEITGVEFLKNLPDEPINIRMILTGFSDMEAIIEAMNSGKVYKYVTKPWEKTELQAVIDEAVSKQRQRQEEKSKLSNATSELASLEKVLRSPYKSEGKFALTQRQLENEIKELNLRVEEAYKNVKLLSEIGQDIISNLTIDDIIASTYENVNSLMDASSFTIGVYKPEENTIECPGSLEKGARLDTFYYPLDEKNRLAVWCFTNQKEIIINDFETEYNKYLANLTVPVMGDQSESILYLPLTTNKNRIGVITVQSFSKHAYTNYHVNILRNIAIYVATALENAQSYHLIEEQKTEIEQKNVELEHKVQQRTEELQLKNEEALKQKDELEATYRNVKLLSEIGQQITSTLSLEKIIETVYENVNSLMDATIFAIGVYNKNLDRLDFPVSMERGEKLPFWFASMDDDNRIPVWCFKNQKEIIINDFQMEYNKYIKSISKPKAGESPDSLIYLPLYTSEGPIGVITVQSFKKHIYNQYHIDILRSLASYITIAIQNSASYQKMTKAFEDLKSTQMKLVEAEKMASLGVLTAGVAHEINNPVNFVSAGIESLISSYGDIKEILNLYFQLNPTKNDPELWNEIIQNKKALENDEVLPEVEQLLKSIKTGAKRTAEIVKGLRNFTRLDENDMKRANLEEGIDNTLVILNNQLKNRIEVVRNYSGIPDINCFPGQLNQVFMNLIHNASQAIEGKGTITIATLVKNNQVHISISDSGSGMPEEVRAHIFEPFFTTKDVGKGTGLGLSIAYGIIEKHHGTIEVESEIDKGTTFHIALPIK